MQSVKLSRACSTLARPLESGLHCAQRDVDHIRRLESSRTKEILVRLPSELRADKDSILSDELDQHGLQVSEKFLYQRLQVCISRKDLELGRQVQAFIRSCGQHSNAFLASHLIRMFSCCGSLSEAYFVFCKLPAHSVFTWSAIIAAFTSTGQNEEACNLFKDMLHSNFEPDEVTFVVILKACTSIPSLIRGKIIHAHIIYSGFELNNYVCNTLIGMYASCGSIVDGYTVFAGLLKQNVASWNAMIGAYVQHGNVEESISVFQNMQKEGMRPNSITCVSILKACLYLTLSQTKFYHIQTIEAGLELDRYVASTLIDVYAKHGSMADARAVFDKLPERDMVTWSSLIAGYVQNQNGQDALSLFQQMQLAGEQGDNGTYVNALNACSTTAAVEQGQIIHACLLEGEFRVDTLLGSALIDMYASHGKLEDARRVFESLLERDVGVWNAIIESCTASSNHNLAIHYFQCMQTENLMPDDITFVCLLSMCSRMGLLEEGWHQLKLMIRQYGILPIVEHYNCIIDLLGRAGLLVEAENVLQNMPWEPTLKSWMSLLSNCKSFGNVALGFHCFKQVFLLDCTHGSAYALMWTLFSGAGLFADASKLVELSNHLQAWKKPGKAYIEIGQNLHAFVVGEMTHPAFQACYRKLKTLRLHGSCEGCMPQLDLYSC